jgi:hypothetical protein
MLAIQSRRAASLLILCLAVPMSACHAQNGASTESAGALPMRQLIIKFKPGSIQCSAADIDKLSAPTGTRIQFLRTVSGDACLVSQPAPAFRSASSGLEILESHPAVEWVEVNAPLKAQ